ncbi:MAG TPA: HAMP domain-containing sensor histidine kinase [Vicinamibacterales bacterium]|nr:HAMP domain-containing sensor histidine kinase [Vicinamibacterales bacterium]
MNRSVTVARLLSGAAHEVNNALQVISGTVELLEGRSDLPDPVAKGVTRLRTQAARAAAALERVLAFTRAAAGSLQSVDLVQLAAECLALREFAVRRAGQTIALAPFLAAPVLVTACRPELQQALLNLILVAEDVIAGTSGAIEIEVAPQEDRASLRVSHTGTAQGLDAQLNDPSARTNDGTGGPVLALWSARVLVERFGGRVSVEAEPRSALVMTLPLAESRDI